MARLQGLATLPALIFIVWTVAGTPLTKDLQALEALDEEHDAEILKAVYTSMEQYWVRKLMGGHRRKRSEPVVCYGDLGCFEDTGPFGYLDMLPSSPEEVSTRFLLYSPNARSDSPLLDVPFANMSGVWPWAVRAFNNSAPTKIIVHGFGSSCSHVWVYEMRTALVTVEECNVICVDWESGAIIPNYVRAAANTRLVGKQLAMLVRGLSEHVGLRLEDIHLIGFSLGAHVAGFAGAELKNVSRITGLDPAGPLFESQDPRARLDSTDAVFVDVIHSNGENLILGGLGSWQPMGHVDFYPNGGRMQKGCTNLFVGAVSDIIWSASDIEGRSLCNHRRAYKFFTDSVSPRCHFPAFHCDSYDAFLEGKCFSCSPKQPCGNMGYYADKSVARGTLFLITREEEPFCAHQYLISLESSPSKLPVVSYGKIQVTLVGDSTINETFTLTKKDDEELGVGAIVSKIVVPHPALQEPNAVEIIYTAYSGWISSGLKKWSIDKIKVTDSFGKSMSVCKKDLILESGVTVKLKLYPGECNLPREQTEATTIDPFFLPEETKNVTDKTVDGYPAYTVFGDDKNITVDAIVKTASAKRTANRTDSHLGKNEIVEPVLQPKVKNEKIEKKSSAIKPRGINLGSSDNSTENGWTPSVELFPPPLGGKQLWETSREPKHFDKIVPPTVAKGKGKVATLQNMLNRTRSSGNRKRMYTLTPKTDAKEGVITVQLLPQNLANLLKQAEQYAKMSLFSPLDIFYRNRSNLTRGERLKRPSEKRNFQNDTKVSEKKEEFIGTPRSLDSRSKTLIPRLYEYFEKGLERVQNLFRWEGTEEQHLDSTDVPENSTLVPYIYESKEASEPKYIPLTEGSGSS